MRSLSQNFGQLTRNRGTERHPPLAPWVSGPAILGLSALLWGVIYFSVAGLLG